MTRAGGLEVDPASMPLSGAESERGHAGPYLLISRAHMACVGSVNAIPENLVPLRLIAYFMRLLSVSWVSRELRDV